MTTSAIPAQEVFQHICVKTHVTAGGFSLSRLNLGVRGERVCHPSKLCREQLQSERHPLKSCARTPFSAINIHVNRKFPKIHLRHPNYRGMSKSWSRISSDSADFPKKNREIFKFSMIFEKISKNIENY